MIQYDMLYTCTQKFNLPRETENKPRKNKEEELKTKIGMLRRNGQNESPLSQF